MKNGRRNDDARHLPPSHIVLNDAGWLKLPQEGYMMKITAFDYKGDVIEVIDVGADRAEKQS